MKSIYNIYLLLIIIVLLSGCTNNPTSMIKESTFITGCYVVEANAKLGMVNSGGGLEVCKLICSKELPTPFYYKYESRGCNAEVGKKP